MKVSQPNKVKTKKPIAVATRTAANHTGNTAAGTVAGVTYRWAHVMKTDCSDLQLVFANFYPTATTESSNANDITIAAGLEYGGLSTRLTFDGAHSKTLAQGGIGITDPIKRSIPVGATFYTRVWVSVPVDGNVFPTSIASNSSLGDGKAATDLTTAFGALAASSGEGFAPAAIVGVPSRDDAVAFALVGDSMVGDANIDGWPVRAVQDDYGYLILSRPGSDVASMEANSGNVYRMRLLRYATHAIVTFGANDFNLPRTYQGAEDYFRSLWAALQGMGIEVYHTTTTPRSTSSDGWTTLSGQTPYTGNAYTAKRNLFNSRLRSGVYPGIKVLDVAAAVESGDVYRASFTGDGVHPLDPGKVAILANITL